MFPELNVQSGTGETSAVSMRFTSPPPDTDFLITKTPEWPSIVFETDATLSAGQQITWEWSIEWDQFSQHAIETTETPSWDASNAVNGLGGTLTVRATHPSGATCLITVLLRGTQPDPTDVDAYLSGQANSAGFDKILQQESHFRHFNASGYPLKSFDKGYGMAQLTNPEPSFKQVWNWKLNIDAALILFGQKRAAAAAYLSQSGRTYTNDQLIHETVCRWNGGHYHVWNNGNGVWVRDPNVLCDSQTGNIGWDMTESENNGKTEVELHKRDQGEYARGRRAGDPWRYFGVCYADRVLGR